MFTRHMFSPYHCFPAESRNAEWEVLGSCLFCQMLWVCGTTLSEQCLCCLKIDDAPIKYFRQKIHGLLVSLCSYCYPYLRSQPHLISLRYLLAQISSFTNCYFRDDCVLEPKSLPSSLRSETFSSLFVVPSPYHCRHSHQHTPLSR